MAKGKYDRYKTWDTDRLSRYAASLTIGRGFGQSTADYAKENPNYAAVLKELKKRGFGGL